MPKPNNTKQKKLQRPFNISCDSHCTRLLLVTEKLYLPMHNKWFIKVFVSWLDTKTLCRSVSCLQWAAKSGVYVSNGYCTGTCVRDRKSYQVWNYWLIIVINAMTKYYALMGKNKKICVCRYFSDCRKFRLHSYLLLPKSAAFMNVFIRVTYKVFT